VSKASSADRPHCETLLLEFAEDDVLVVKFNRPKAANAPIAVRSTTWS
jgi:hypothetical protein